METNFKDLSPWLKFLVICGTIEVIWNAIVFIAYGILFFSGNL